MELYYQGIVLGLATFVLIGLFHPLVINTEYHFGVRFWIVFLLVGLLSSFISLLIKNITISSLFGVFGFSCFWSIKEMFDQAKRVKEGRYPKNPKRNYE